MAKFLFIYRDPVEPRPQPSPEEMQQFLALWGQWFEKFPGAIVDGGDALQPSRDVQGVSQGEGLPSRCLAHLGEFCHGSAFHHAP